MFCRPLEAADFVSSYKVQAHDTTLLTLHPAPLLYNTVPRCPLSYCGGGKKKKDAGRFLRQDSHMSLGDFIVRGGFFFAPFSSSLELARKQGLERGNVCGIWRQGIGLGYLGKN